MEWTPARIRTFREVGLCKSQQDFAAALGFSKRTIGNAERGTHPPSLALRRALDDALEHASPSQRHRFQGTGGQGDDDRSASLSGRTEQHPVNLAQLRNVVLGVSTPPAYDATSPTSPVSAAAEAVLAHRCYQLANYDAAAQLLPSVLSVLQDRTKDADTEALVGTLTTRHALAVAYLVASKLAAKLGDIVLASVTADRALSAARESGEHPALMGAAAYQVARPLLATDGLSLAAEFVQGAIEAVTRAEKTPQPNVIREERASVHGSLLLLLAIVEARRADHPAASRALRSASRLADQLGYDGNWLWTAFGPTNVAIHELAVHSSLGDPRRVAQIAATIDADALPTELLGRRAQVHLELSWSAAYEAQDATAVLHLLEAERVAPQSVSRHAHARELISMLMARERRRVTPGLRALASRAGVIR